MKTYNILVTAYNEEKLLPLCLEAINNQSLEPHRKLLIDDGSTDHTEQIAKNYGFKVHTIPNEKYLESYKNRARAFHTGISLIESPTPILKVDADIIIPPNYAEWLREVLRNPRIGIASGSSTTHYNKRGISNGAVMYRREVLTQAPMVYGWDRQLVLHALKKGYKIYSHPTLRYVEMRPLRVKRPPLPRLVKNFIENTALKIYSDLMEVNAAG